MSLRIFDHPAHTAIVHFPIGLCCTAVLWDAIWLTTGNDIWWHISFFTLAAGLVSSIPAAFTGFVDYVTLPEGHPALTTATRHLVVTGSGLGAFLTSFLVRADAGSPGDTTWWLAPAFALVGAGLFGVGGWLGGELVLRYGVGRIETDGRAGDPATREVD